MKVEDVMSKTVHTCSMETSLQTVALTMWDNDCGCIPVVDAEHRPVAIVTDRDIAIGSALQHRPLWDMSVEDVSGGHPLFCCKDDEDIHDALKMMQEHSIRRLPVIRDNGQLAGLVSMGDILAKAGARAKSKLPVADVMAMLKTVTGHHGEIMRVA